MPLTTLQRLEIAHKFLEAAATNRTLKLSKFFRDEGYDLPVNSKRGDPYHADYHAVNSIAMTYKTKLSDLAQKIQGMRCARQEIVEEDVPQGNDDLRQLFNQLMALDTVRFRKLVDLVEQTRTSLAGLT